MWYDLFSLFYDRALEDLYAPFRPAAVQAMALKPGDTALDIPCGTGQSLGLLVEAVGPAGKVAGIDQSQGMLRKANQRIRRSGWENVLLRARPAADIHADLLGEVTGRTSVDAVICALGLTALPDWERTFHSLFSLVRPGGRFVLFDVYAEESTSATKMVQMVARADLSRPVWKPLEKICADFKMMTVSDDSRTFGGQLFVASGTRDK